MSFENKTILVTGASRGIGKAIALKLAKEGANIVIAAKSVEENLKLGGTIFSAAREIEQAGGRALPLQCDIRFEDQVKNVVDKAVEVFGGIDIVINNASAISLTSTQQTEPKRFDLMHSVKKSTNAHILTLSPPLNLEAKWFANHLAYTITKYNMSMMTIGWAKEFKEEKIAANSLWPRTTIATAAIKNLLGGDALMKMSRKPEILADAAYYILKQPSTECTGNLFIDEEVLARERITDLSKYSVVEGGKLYDDLFV